MTPPASTRPSGYERILSLDGGGTWALIQVRTLMDLYGPDARGHEVLSNFDLVAANSGGSLVAAGLALDMPLSKILELFEDPASLGAVFQDTLFQSVVPWHEGHALPVPRYSTDAKRESLHALLGPGSDIELRAWHARHPTLAHLLITTFDYDVIRAAFFRTDTASLAASRSSSAPVTATLLDAVHSSGNPPVRYFDAPAVVPAVPRERRFWDGGVGGYNNPALAGVVEALANGAEASRIHVLAIGTGTVHRPRRPAGVSASDPRFMGGESPGLIGDFEKLATSILDDPPDAASFIAHVALGGSLPRGEAVVTDGPLVRMNPVVRPARTGEADDAWAWLPALPVSTWVRLAELELDASAPRDVALIGDLCKAWLAGKAFNQPIRADADLAAEIGHDTYADAKRAAQAWIYRDRPEERAGAPALRSRGA